MSLHSKLKKQIEFYFSNSNYRVDKYLSDICEKNDGIEISTLLKFKKIEILKPTVEDIIESLKDSKIVEIVDNNKLRKIKDEKYNEYIKRNDHDDYIVHVSGFPSTFTLEDVENVLLKYCNPLLIRMRKNKNMCYTGSAFVELETKEEVENLIKQKIKVDLIGGLERVGDFELAPVEKRKLDTENKRIKVDNEKDVIKKDDNEDKQIKANDKKDDNENIKDEKKDENDCIKKDDNENMVDEENYLKIVTKKEYLENKSKNPKIKIDRETQKMFKNYDKKLYSYETDQDFNIQDIKNAISGVAFVDINKKTIRFKNVQEFENKEFDEKIKLKKLSDEDTKKYFNEVMEAKKKRKK